MPSSAVEGELALGVNDPLKLYESGRPLRDLFAPQWHWSIEGVKWMSRRNLEIGRTLEIGRAAVASKARALIAKRARAKVPA